MLADSIDKYKVYELLGKGGFAEVYRAVELESGTEVAIKKISKQSVTERNMWERVKQELAIHSVLEHSSIVKVFTCFQDINYIYLVLEFCSNGELRKLLEERNLPFNENQARGVLRQVLPALKYLHSHRIIHRDLTLSNILLTRDWNVKIADFGLAVKFSQPDEKHKTMCGTPNYIAPEVVTRKNQGPETDIWNIGILLYTLLVGKPPFDTEYGGVKTTLQKVVTAEIIWPSNLSSDAVHLMNLMLKKDPSQRITLSDIFKHAFMVQSTYQDLRMLTPTLSHLYEDSGFMTTLCTSLNTGGSSDTSPFSYKHVFGHLSSISSCCSTFNSKSKPSCPHLTSLVKPHSTACSHSSDNCCVQGSHIENGACHLLERLCHRGNSNHANYSTQYQNFNSVSHQDSIQVEDPKNTEISCSAPILKTSTTPFHGTVRVLPPDISVPPLNTTRLRTKLRTKAKMVYFSILKSGEVCLEFIKDKTHSSFNKFVEIMLISADGSQISLQHPYEGSTEPGKGVAFINYLYEDLPERFLKKYLYALKCVNNEKAVTSKIIYYSQLGKCHLMENGPNPNFTVHFYSGEKIIKKGDLVEILDKNLKVISTHPTHFSGGTLRPSLKSLWNHFRICWDECLMKEKDLDELSIKRREIVWFPNTSGQKPNTNLQRENLRYHDEDDKENLSQKLPPQVLSRKASASAPSSLVGRSLKASSRQKIIKTATVQGIGTAFLMFNGLVCVNFSDKTKLEVQPSTSKNTTLFTFKDINYHILKYEVKGDDRISCNIPETVREKISLYGIMVEKLKNS